MVNWQAIVMLKKCICGFIATAITFYGKNAFLRRVCDVNVISVEAVIPLRQNWFFAKC